MVLFSDEAQKHSERTVTCKNAQQSYRDIDISAISSQSMSQSFLVMVLVYKSLHHLAPPYLSDDCQLVADVGRRSSNQLMSTHVRSHEQSRLGDRSFGVAGPRLWNSLPAELRQQDICLTEFWRLLKTFLFAETRRIAL